MAIEHPFFFMRHGQTAWNARGQTQGQLDSALSPVGRAQADEAARRLSREKIDRIVSSPLSRVRETAERTAHFHRLEVEYDETLMECHLGAAEGHQHGKWLREYWTGKEDARRRGAVRAVCRARLWRASPDRHRAQYPRGCSWRHFARASGICPRRARAFAGKRAAIAAGAGQTLVAHDSPS